MPLKNGTWASKGIDRAFQRPFTRLLKRLSKTFKG
jgi:hypothetical protein